jgi:N-acetylglutamate synthase-like GNAT family acetyltransferase
MSTEPYRVRPAGFEDAGAIFRLIKAFPEELVPRPISDIVQNIDRILVAERAGAVVGTVSWKILPEIGAPRDPSVEIQSLAVDSAHQGGGVGRALLDRVIGRVAELHPRRIIVLTFHPEFFMRFGFATVPKESLMHKIYLGCANCTKYDSPFTCPEVAMAMECRFPTAEPDGPPGPVPAGAR